jgi:hypothetical protein
MSAQYVGCHSRPTASPEAEGSAVRHAGVEEAAPSIAEASHFRIFLSAALSDDCFTHNAGEGREGDSSQLNVQVSQFQQDSESRRQLTAMIASDWRVLALEGCCFPSEDRRSLDFARDDNSWLCFALRGCASLFVVVLRSSWLCFALRGCASLFVVVLRSE